MKKIMVLLGIIFLFGCTPKVKVEPKPEIIYIEKVAYYDKCPVVEEPIYRPLDLTAHIGSAYNVNILIDNLTIMVDYVTSLKNGIECYERQVK